MLFYERFLFLRNLFAFYEWLGDRIYTSNLKIRFSLQFFRKEESLRIQHKACFTLYAIRRGTVRYDKNVASLSTLQAISSLSLSDIPVTD